jgi:hypothetical protein
MNRHLNIFRAFSQNLSHENIENNLSRALVLCLQNNSLLLHEFLRTIFSETNQQALYTSIFTDVTALDNFSMDIQVQMNTINTEEFSKIFAIAISGAPLDMSDFLLPKNKATQNQITDIFFTLNDIAFIIEVKPNNTDCKNQLYQQVAAVTNTVSSENVFPLDFNWKKLMEMIIQINGFQKLNHQTDKLLNDFISLVKSHNPNWLPVPPFASIGDTIQNKYKFKQRTEAALNSISNNHTILNYSDRIGLQINTAWATEIVIYIHENKNQKVDLHFGIWPGNTKGQGWQMISQLNKTPNWTPPNQININNTIFKIEWGYEIKFCHFNGFVSNLIISDRDLKPGKKIISDTVHRNHTGKYNRDKWNKLESFLDDYLVDNFNWRKNMKWDKNFVQTKRTYLTMSIGYQIEVIIPISAIQKIDAKIDDLHPFSEMIVEIKNKLTNIFSL